MSRACALVGCAYVRHHAATGRLDLVYWEAATLQIVLQGRPPALSADKSNWHVVKLGGVN